MFDVSPGGSFDLGKATVVDFRGIGAPARRPRKVPAPFVTMTWPQSRRGEATINGHRVHIAPACHQLLQLLLFADPMRSVPLQELVETMWPNPETQPDTASVIVRMYVRQLRKVGVRIEGRAGFGYRIPVENRGRPDARERKLRDRPDAGEQDYRRAA